MCQSLLFYNRAETDVKFVCIHSHKERPKPWDAKVGDEQVCAATMRCLTGQNDASMQGEAAPVVAPHFVISHPGFFRVDDQATDLANLLLTIPAAAVGSCALLSISLKGSFLNLKHTTFLLHACGGFSYSTPCPYVRR